MHEPSSIRRALGIGLSLIMIMSGVTLPWTGVVDGAYAKAVGDKNGQTCDNCKNVVKGKAPSMKDYSSYEAGKSTLDDKKTELSYGANGYSESEETYESLLGGAVYRGGNAESGKLQNAVAFDKDPDDFASVLPYGNTYIDTNKMYWTAQNKKNFKIDIQDPRFVWIAGEDYAGLKDATDQREVNTDPLGDGRGLQSNLAPVIAYVGPVKGYLGDTEADWRSDSKANPDQQQKNIITAPAGSYLYKITYPEAATLMDGTKGDLVIEVAQVEIETTATQDKAVITLQRANALDLSANLKDKNGNYINRQDFVALTAADVASVTAGNSAWNTNNNKDKTTLAATGAIIDIAVKVVDAEGNPVKGSISYAARDMDLETYQDLWGRSMTGENRYKFNEAITIVDGSLSYAVTPYYDHANATKRDEGWIPVPPGYPDLISPLHITKSGSGSHADGVRFSGVGSVVMRDKNGSFSGSMFTGDGAATEAWPNKVITVFGGRADNADRYNKDYSGQTPNNYAKRLLYGRVKDGSGNNVPWDNITAAQIYNELGAGSYGARRNDDGKYDTGFAVLMDASGFNLQWSGSMQNGGSVVTTLFDTSVYTYIEQTHGTGGGIYFETYDITADCKANRSEGTVTMGKGTDATVTVVPEDGYRIDTIKIGGKALESPSAFTPVYDDSGYVMTIKDNNGSEYSLTNHKVTITDQKYGAITFEENDGGSIDVTLPNMDKARHVHADFTADYYFYKVWKSKTQAPTSLKLTATPYAYKFKEVTIDGDKYTISGNTFTNTNTKKSYTLANNALKIGEEPNVTVYYLEGNDLVSYKYDPTDPDSRTEDNRYTIRLEYEQNGDPVQFEVIKDDADDTDETNVIATTDEDDYPVWKIRYPAAGYKPKHGKAWPALPIETTPSAHNINHVERNYWFVTEDAPGWALVEYDNSKAEAPGDITKAGGRTEIYREGDSGNLSAWALSSTKDVENSGAVIRHASSSNHAYMSVFSNHDKAITKHNNTWGGKIVNIPLVVVNAEKTWDDFSNAFGTRQDVWFHIDATIGDEKTKDILPPQKLVATESGNVQTKTWGNKKAYGDDYLSEYAETDVDYSKIKVVGTTSDLPKDKYYAQDSANPNKFIPMVEDGYEEVGGIQVPKYKVDEDGDVYYVNELTGVDSDGEEIKYTLRETDAKGNELNKTDTDEYLIGYESEVSDVKKDAEQATLDEVKVDSYTGKVKNTLETVDFEITKIWKENGATGDERAHATDADFDRDVAKLKENYTLNENGKVVTDTATIKLQPKNAEKYVPASGDDPASGTLETKKGTDGTEIVFKWHKIPKYVGDVDGEGKATVRQAVYSVVETSLNGYNAPDYDNSSTDAEGKNGETDAAYNKGEITNEVTPPEGTPKETWGEKDQPQSVSGKDMFKVTTDTDIEGETNEIKEVKLIDPNTGEPADSVTVPEGTYTVDGDGNITFTPKTGFVGNPTPVGVRGTDANGLSADTTYTPHICDTETTVKRTIVYEYSNGDPVLDGEGNPKTVIQTVTFKGIINPDTGEITYPGNPTETFPEVTSGDITGYTVDRPKVEDETVRPRDKDLFEKVIYSPLGVSATPDRTYGLPNEPQNGTLPFKMETETYTDGTPNELTIKLVDPKTGKEVDGKSVPAVDDEGNTVGTYTLNDNGTVTFTPSKDYVGNPRPLEVTGTDKFGTKARTTYTPHIVDPVIEDEASRNITYTYLTEDGEEASATITQKVTLKRHAKKVDPKTGEVLEWDDWEPAEFPAVPNPGHVDEKTWTANKSAQAATVTEPGPAEDVHIVYTKEPYTVIYHNGAHGKSDGKGNQKNEDYGNDVTGGNGVTPAKGWHFTGTYTYVIKDKTGKVISRGSTDDPTSVEITGNVEFTPVYAPNKYTIKYDANGGSGNMTTQKFTGTDSSATSKANAFTRKNYAFTGFKAKDKQGNYLKDKNGKEIVFKSTNDFIEYLHKQGDGGEITLVAQWKKLPHATYIDPATGRTIQVTKQFNDDGTEPLPPADPTRPGYIFAGWDRTVDGEGNVVYKAMWEPDKDYGTGKKGSDSNSGKSASTGDASSFAIPIILLIAAGCGASAIVLRRRRRNESN